MMDKKKLLNGWCAMERLADHLGEDEDFGVICNAYYAKVEKRIKLCETFFPDVEKRLFYYTLAELHDRYDAEDWPECPHKRKAAYYAIKAIREDRSIAPAWALLSEIYSWIVDSWGADEAIREQDAKGIPPESEGTEDKGSYLDREYALTFGQKRRLQMIERAILSIKKAIKLDPTKEYYRCHLEVCYRQRNEEFKPSHIFRNPAPPTHDQNN